MRTTQELWTVLHCHPHGSHALLEHVRAELPCPSCVEHFDAFRRVYPPVYGPGWFEWTVELHNSVNALLEKPEWSLAEATRAWRNSFLCEHCHEAKFP